MSLFTNAIAVAKRINKIIVYTAVAILVIGVPTILIRGYLKTPSFLLGIEEKAEKSPAIKTLIGDFRGYSISFSEEELQTGDTAKFAVRVTGECDSAYALYKGIYSPVGKTFAY